jgi:hypothetical protein
MQEKDEQVEEAIKQDESEQEKFFFFFFFFTVYLSKQDNDNMYRTWRTDITSPLFSKKRRHFENSQHLRK